jgi:hypothetical protein
MEEAFSVRFIIFSNGERYPLLLNHEKKPHWYATLYATTQIRNASKAPNTIAAVLAVIRVLFSWARSQEQNLEYRFSQRNFLNEQELDSLRSYSQTKVEASGNQKIKPVSQNNIERIRGKFNVSESRISSGTHYIRLTYIADYLERKARLTRL